MRGVRGSPCAVLTPRAEFPVRLVLNDGAEAPLTHAVWLKAALAALAAQPQKPLPQVFGALSSESPEDSWDCELLCPVASASRAGRWVAVKAVAARAARAVAAAVAEAVNTPAPAYSAMSGLDDTLAQLDELMAAFESYADEEEAESLVAAIADVADSESMLLWLESEQQQVGWAL